jgi:hypothetical protein
MAWLLTTIKMCSQSSQRRWDSHVTACAMYCVPTRSPSSLAYRRAASTTASTETPLLRRRKQREGESRPPTHAGCRGGWRFPDSRRRHAQVI